MLFLLHGLFGSHSNWTELTSLEEYVSAAGFLVICPEGADSWYTDRPDRPDHRFETHILDEIIPDAEGRFGAGGSKARRAVAGLSMGGYGAFKFAFHRPEMFCFAGSMSGAFDIRSFLENEGGKWDELFLSVSEAFGGRTGTDLADEDVYSLAANCSDPTEIPKLYLDCGRDDDFLGLNRRFSEVLASANIPHEYGEHPGGHDWDYWNRRVRTVLDRAGSAFGI